jgi:hypothetical protein
MTMSCCGKKRKEAKGSRPTLASPVAILTRRDPEPETTPKPVTPPVTKP